MIQAQTICEVADNTGAKSVMCFKVLGGSRKRYASIGDVIICSVKSADSKGIVKKGEKVRAVVVRSSRAVKRADGSAIKFDENAVVLIHETRPDPRGTRIFGPVARELRGKGYTRIVSLSKEVL